LLFYTRQAELARAQTRYGTTTKARSAALLWSMMARGGRENGAQRRNPNRITKDEAPDKSQALLFYARLLS
jgi:hypothetical protein